MEGEKEKRERMNLGKAGEAVRDRSHHTFLNVPLLLVIDQLPHNVNEINAFHSKWSCVRDITVYIRKGPETTAFPRNSQNFQT